MAANWTAGETGPRIFTMTDGLTVFDLTGSTIVPIMHNVATGAAVASPGSCVIANSPGTDGQVKYTPAGGTMVVGVYYVHFKVTKAGLDYDFPASAGDVWRVYAQ